jgi:glyoxylate carboligase
MGYLGLSHWELQRTDQPVTVPFVPLGALSRNNGVTVVGRAVLAGVSTTEYRVSVPASAVPGMHIEPYVAYVWLDKKGRIRNMLARWVGTGTKGREAPLTTSVSTTLSDFGAPVRVQAPAGARALRS